MKNITLKKTRRALIGIAIALSIGVIFTLPSGVHLELCFGFDGHVDATTGPCTAGSTRCPQLQAEWTDEHHHHENCFDVVIGCATMDFLARFTEKDGPLYTAQDEPFMIAGNIPNTIQPVYSPNCCTFLPNIGNSSPALLSRQTVVLLI